MTCQETLSPPNPKCSTPLLLFLLFSKLLILLVTKNIFRAWRAYLAWPPPERAQTTTWGGEGSSEQTGRALEAKHCMRAQEKAGVTTLQRAEHPQRDTTSEQALELLHHLSITPSRAWLPRRAGAQESACKQVSGV